MKLGIKIRLNSIKEMPITCFNRVTGIKSKYKWLIRNHVFGLKGIYGVIITIHFKYRIE